MNIRDNKRRIGIAIAGAAMVVALASMGWGPADPRARVGGIAIEHAWAKGGASPGQTLPIFLTITNSRPDGDRLVGIRSPIAQSAIIKKLERDGAFLRAMPIDVVDLQPGERLNLRQAAYQISLLAMMRSVRPGEKIPVIIQFERAGDIEASVVVENIGEPDHAEHLS